MESPRYFITFLLCFLTVARGTNAAGPCDNFNKHETCPIPHQKMHCAEQPEWPGSRSIVAVRGCFFPKAVRQGYTIRIVNGHLTTVPCEDGTYSLYTQSYEVKCVQHTPCFHIDKNMVELEPARTDSLLKCGCKEGYRIRGTMPYCTELNPDAYSCLCIKQTTTVAATCPIGTGVLEDSQENQGCKPCPWGTFNDGKYKICKTWSRCDENEVELVAGSKKNDRECRQLPSKHETKTVKLTTVTTKTPGLTTAKQSVEPIIAKDNTVLIVTVTIAILLLGCSIFAAVVIWRTKKKPNDANQRATNECAVRQLSFIINETEPKQPEVEPLVDHLEDSLKHPIPIADTSAKSSDANNPVAFHIDAEDNM